MVLESPRLILRELCMADVAAMNEIEADPRVARYTAFEPRSLEQSREKIEESVRSQGEEPRETYDLAIVLRQAANPVDGASIGPLIGRCGLGIQRLEHREAMIWYVLHPAQWGRGYAVEAAGALLAAAFTTLGLHRVWADCDPRNAASCKVATRLGMRHEGRLRENWWLKGEWCSSDIYGILEDEWRERSGLKK
jgi:RimJ/RimL family protein N-acetyltransferase